MANLKMTNILMEWTDTGAHIKIESATPGLSIPCPRCDVMVGAGKDHLCGDQKPVTKPRKKQKAL
jgi:hypothetical protein